MKGISTLKSSLRMTIRPFPVPKIQNLKYLSSMPLHCPSCTCEPACGVPPVQDPLPPPLPEPKVSFRRRILSPQLIALQSQQGRQKLIRALTEETAAPYIALTEQFVNQSDPAFCGITTLLMVLNTFAIDPKVRWRGGWRFYGDETFLLSQCCMDEERIRRIGIHMEDLQRIAKCQGLRVEMKRPGESSIDAFREDIMESLSGNELNNIVVVSFSRGALDQTGDGHFSPIAAIHDDHVLVLDVARFKYQPYWVSITDLYNALKPLDEATGKPRGWMLMNPPASSSSYSGSVIEDEGRIDVEYIPSNHSPCPLHKVKVDYCKSPLKRL